ncbi:YkgJ family cysteine cluster protein [Pseudomonas sp. X4]|uniref:YkgJ family cysteine cluster protein n=1 Tax=Pseudomonas sp. X4 TaxID=3231526 RepID=UPI00345F2831
MITSDSALSRFPCNQCGLCCQRVDKSDETRFLDRGDGVCSHYDSLRKGCGIYEQRPDICRVDRQYVERFAEHYGWDEFVAMNVAVCIELQNDGHRAVLCKSTS